MRYNKIALNISVRLMFMLLTLVAGILIWQVGRFYFLLIIPFLLLVLQVVWAIKMLNKINNDFNRFLTSLEVKDNTLYFDADKVPGVYKELYTNLNKATNLYKGYRVEAENLFLLYSNILQNSNQGVIVIKEAALSVDRGQNSDNVLEFINNAACNILQIPKHKYWYRVVDAVPDFAEVISGIRTSGKTLVKVSVGSECKELSVDVNICNVADKRLFIIIFQDIRDEIEQREIDAWQKLIKILTHEIMNSLTPIKTLSETISEIIKEDEPDTEDIDLAVSTINRRADGLMQFVDNYRLIIDMPSPVLKPVKLADVINNVQQLMKPLVADRDITFDIDNQYGFLVLDLDMALIEQVLINLITNSIYATEDVTNAKIKIAVNWISERYTLTVSDNGKGIPQANLDMVFIPFFSTRDGGSGIGLSISRNIMRAHKGSLRAESENGETRMILSF
jgi:nitrogen fixation/metabolism regulation signal transduction histidine kinase